MDIPAHHHNAQLLQLIYCSRSRLTGSPDKIESLIQQLLVVSRRNNTAESISGALLYNGSAFAQVLEGPEDAVERCFDRILLDERHTSIMEVSRELISRRVFPTWAMAYVDGASVRPLSDASVDLGSMLVAGKSRSGFVLNLLQDVMVTHEQV